MRPLKFCVLVGRGTYANYRRMAPGTPSSSRDHHPDENSHKLLDAVHLEEHVKEAGTKWMQVFDAPDKTDMCKSHLIDFSTETIEQLVVHIHEGNQRARAGATKALRNLAASNEANQGAIAAAGAFEPLVAQLKLGSAQLKEAVAGALSNLASNHADNQVAIANAGAIEPLVDLLKSKSPGAQKAAAGALSNLAANEDNQVAICGAAGCLKSLVHLLRRGNAGVQAAAAGCLVNLAANDANQVAITDADAVEPLINLLGGGSAVYLAYLQTAAASALRNLAYKNIHNQVLTIAQS